MMKNYFLGILLSCVLASALSAQTCHIQVTYLATPTTAQQTAVDFAKAIWEETLVSSVPIKVNINFLPLPSGNLGITFPNGIKDFTGAPLNSTWYPTALANAITGTELNTGQSDMDITLSSVANWYYGTDGICPAAKTDFVSVVLHEMGHGLGFISLAKKTGTIGSLGTLQQADFAPLASTFNWPNLDTLPSAFDRLMINNNQQSLCSFQNPSATLGGILTSGNVFFNGVHTQAANGGNEAKLYAPSTFVLGTSTTHLDESTYPNGNPNELMTPFSAPGFATHNLGPITIGVMQDIGWLINPALGIEQQATTPAHLSVWPNPTNHTLFLSVDTEGSLIIYNLMGEALFSTSVTKGMITEYPAYKLPAGTYIAVSTSKESVEPVLFQVTIGQ